jgi:hypothetical protein
MFHNTLDIACSPLASYRRYQNTSRKIDVSWVIIYTYLIIDYWSGSKTFILVVKKCSLRQIKLDAL